MLMFLLVFIIFKINNSNHFLIRFILDDSALYLSDKCDSDTVDLRRGNDVMHTLTDVSACINMLIWHLSVCHTDYVCVLDIDLLELAITTWKGSDTGKLVSENHLFTYLCFLQLHSAVLMTAVKKSLPLPR